MLQQMDRIQKVCYQEHITFKYAESVVSIKNRKESFMVIQGDIVRSNRMKLINEKCVLNMKKNVS